MSTIKIFEKTKLRQSVTSATRQNFDRYYRVDYSTRTVSIDIPENKLVKVPDSIRGIAGIALNTVNLVIPKGWNLDIVQKQTADVSQIAKKGVSSAILAFEGSPNILANRGTIRINQVITLTNINQIVKKPSASAGGGFFALGGQVENKGIITIQGKFILGKNTSQLDSKKRLFLQPLIEITPFLEPIFNEGIIAIFVPEYPGYSQAELNTVKPSDGGPVSGLFYAYYTFTQALKQSGTVLLVPPIRLDPCRCQLQILPHLYFSASIETGGSGRIISYASGLTLSPTKTDSPLPQIEVPRGWNQFVRVTTFDFQSGQEEVFSLPPNVTNSALALQYQFQQQIRKVPSCYWDIQAIRRLANRYQNFLGKTTPIPNPGPQLLDIEIIPNRQLTRRVRGSLARRLQDRVLGKKEEDSDDDSEFDWGAKPESEAKAEPEPPTEPEAKPEESI